MLGSRRTKLTILASVLAGAVVAITIWATGVFSGDDGEPAGVQPAGISLPAWARQCETPRTVVASVPGVEGKGPGWLVGDGVWLPIGDEAIVVGVKEGDTDPLPVGITPGTLRSDGSIAVKLPWWRDRRGFGKLAVSGYLHSDRSIRLRASLGTGPGPRSHVVPSSVIFPRGGCWDISATAEHAELKTTLLVLPKSSIAQD